MAVSSDRLETAETDRLQYLFGNRQEHRQERRQKGRQEGRQEGRLEDRLHNRFFTTVSSDRQENRLRRAASSDRLWNLVTDGLFDNRQRCQVTESLVTETAVSDRLTKTVSKQFLLAVSLDDGHAVSMPSSGEPPRGPSERTVSMSSKRIVENGPLKSAVFRTFRNGRFYETVSSDRPRRAFRKPSF
jgi:hypothetical protein